MNAREGTQFGPYRLVRMLGKGGMGEVYEAYDTSKDRTVAVKLLPEHLAKDPVYQERFRRESRAAARLQEPHVIPIHDFGEIDGVLFLDMRLVRGEDLRATLNRAGHLEAPRAVAVTAEIASALDAAHRDGLVHRDVKPENILLTEGDFAYLVDFGIAESGSDHKLTEFGSVIGSMAYMAPERFDNAPLTPAADIYSLACVLFETLAGAPPFTAATMTAMMSAHVTAPPPQVSAGRDLPPGLDAVLARALAKNPQDRYPTAGEFARAALSALNAADQNATSTILAKSRSAPTVDETKPPTAQLPAGPFDPRQGGGTADDPTRLRSVGGAPPPGYGQTPYQQPGYGPPGYGAVPSGMPSSGPAPYGHPPAGGPSYGGPPPGFPAHQGYPPPPRRTAGRSPLVPALLAVLVVVLLGAAGVLGWMAYSNSRDGSATPAAGGTTSASPGPVTQTVEPPAQPPPDARPCPAVFGAVNGYASSAVGTEVTSCPFAEEVRLAYAQGGDRGQNRSVVAVSPVTQQTYTMDCTVSGGLVTCRGGNNAVVHVY